MNLAWHPILLLTAIAGLSACAGTQSYVRLLESDGTVRVDTADDPSYDYKVAIANRVDFDWDGDNREDRMETVHLLFGESCKSVDVIDETAIPTGTTITGRPTRTWVMKVKCIH